MRVVVIGAGLLGLVTAHFLKRHGLEVLVVDRRDGVAREASFANGGMLHASLANPWNEPGIVRRALGMLGREDAALLVRPRAVPRMIGWGLAFVRNSAPRRYATNAQKNARLARYSLSAMPALREALACEYDRGARGTLKVFREAAGLSAAEQLCASFAPLGVRHTRLDAAGAVGLEPALAPIEHQIIGAIHFPDDESGDAYKFCLGLHAAGVRAGIEYRFGANATRFVRTARRIAAVEIDGEPLAADAFVLAAGSYSPVLGRTAGVRVPIQPVKGYSVTLPLAGWSSAPQVPVIDDQMHAAVCPLGDRLRVAGTAEFAGYDRALNPQRIDNLLAILRRIFPASAPYLDARLAECWTELRPMSCDGVAIMGGTAVENLFLNTGHGHLGWTMAAGAGKAVAALIAGAPADFDLEPYTIKRFDTSVVPGARA